MVVTVTTWRWIHTIPIKIIWRLSITFYMSGVEEHIIPGEFRASTISWQYHLVFSRYQRFQWTSHIRPNKSCHWGNVMKTDPCPHPLHGGYWYQSIFLCFEWMWGPFPMWIESLNHSTWQYHSAPNSDSDQRFHLTSLIMANKGGGVWTIPCGFRASNPTLWYHSVPSNDQRFHLTSILKSN
jgi:hypothetical protein